MSDEAQQFPAHQAAQTSSRRGLALLRTIEASFGLPVLGHAGTSSTPVLAGLLKAPAPR